jgi:hypothetical protein
MTNPIMKNSKSKNNIKVYKIRVVLVGKSILYNSLWKSLVSKTVNKINNIINKIIKIKWHITNHFLKTKFLFCSIKYIKLNAIK